MASFSIVHIFYLVGVLAILTTLVLKKDIILPCIVFIFLIGILITNTFFGGFQVIFNSVLYAGKNFMDIIITIALITSLSKLLSDLNSDYLMFRPTQKFMKNKFVAFWILGFGMYLCSLFLWPSPSVALIGAIMLPLALNSGLKPIEAAIAINIFGHGMALSHDFIIQGAPNVTAKTAGISSANIIFGGAPLFITMNVVTALVAFYFIVRDHSKNTNLHIPVELEKKPITTASKIMAVLTPIVFLGDIIAIFILGYKGGDATSVVVGSATFLLVLGTILQYKEKSFDEITGYIKHGFAFGIKIFAPVIVIGAFFFLGGSDIHEIVGETSFQTEGFMTDFALWVSNSVPVGKVSVMIMQMGVGAITGLDGSGFSGLPLVGTIAATFGTAANISTLALATLGQITAVWVGGGVIIPWAVIAVAAICGVDPVLLAKRNLIPVLSGFVATFIVACIFY